MRVVVRSEGTHFILSMREKAQLLAKGTYKRDLHRGVVDAGRKTKTQVQKAVLRQMALKKSAYGKVVVAGTRGVGNQAQLSYSIFGLKGGQRIENYVGLRVLAKGGLAAAAANQGRGPGDEGRVKSGVWNMPRVFKRSFEQGGGYFALLPKSAGSTSRAPKALWTYGKKPNQPRQGNGRFGRSKTRYGRIRRLFGPSLRKEIPQGSSLATFQAVAPKLLEEAVMKRLNKLLEF